jgi:hypothetical protein
VDLGGRTTVSPSTLALAAFAVALVAGAASGNAPIIVLARALGAMVACLVVGHGLALLASHIATSHALGVARPPSTNAQQQANAAKSTVDGAT